MIRLQSSRDYPFITSYLLLCIVCHSTVPGGGRLCGVVITWINSAICRCLRAESFLQAWRKPTAIEAKFVDNWSTSLRNPESVTGSKPWAIAEQQKMVDQAKKYTAGFAGAQYITRISLSWPGTILKYSTMRE